MSISIYLFCFFLGVKNHLAPYIYSSIYLKLKQIDLKFKLSKLKQKLATSMKKIYNHLCFKRAYHEANFVIDSITIQLKKI